MNQIPQQFYYKRNRLQQIKGFCYTVQMGSMAKAAEKMGLTPSSITLQIKSLERDLKINLFERDAKKIKLTHEGEMFYEHAIFYVQGIENLFENFIKLSQSNKSGGTISIAGNVSVCYLLPKYIQKFEEKHPEVKFKIKNLVKHDAINRILNDEVDILFYSMTKNMLPKELDFFPIVSYPTILLTSAKHPLTRKKKITPYDIKKYKLLRLDSQFITASNFDEISAVYGFETKIDFEMANYEILKKFVKSNVGIAIVSKICLEDDNDKALFAKDMSQYFPHLTYGVIVKRGKIINPLLQEFIDLLKTEKLLEIQN